jgi:hypothetical protein
VGNGKSMMATKDGSLKCCVIQVDGSELVITLHKVKYVSELWVNLFGISKALKKKNTEIKVCLFVCQKDLLFVCLTE